MKISYKVVKDYLNYIGTPEEIAEQLIMHAAEVEEIEYEGGNLENVVVGEVVSCVKHPDSEKLNCTRVNTGSEEFSIVCGAPNVKAGIKVAVALVGAKLTPEFEIKKTKIRGEVSEGMICSEDELGLTSERQAGIMILPDDSVVGTPVRELFNLNDAILEVDNKAINHRPDLFSHIGVIREIAAINGKSFDYKYEDKDFSNLADLGIKNQIPEEVSRYIGVLVSGVKNIDSPDYIKQVLSSADCDSKGLLIDVSNYSLYLYGQPTHCFDADKIDGNINIRYAKNGENFTGLNDVDYELSQEDIVIVDNSKVLALGGVIGGKSSAVSDETTSIVIEAAHFNQATVRKTGKRLGIRTDSLNVFEKDILPEMAPKGASLIVSELEKNLGSISLKAFSDVYSSKQKSVEIDYDLNFINNLIGREYDSKQAKTILNNLGIQISANKLLIPFWRKDLVSKADIAEEICRIDGYNNVVATVPRINIGAVKQTNIYKLKNSTREYFTSIGYFDMYNYSFVNDELMTKMGQNLDGLIPLKNALSLDQTHMRGSLLPNLMLSLEKNSREFSGLKLFEIEKVFNLKGENEIREHYNLSGVLSVGSEIPYYEMMNTIKNLFSYLGVQRYVFDNIDICPTYAHPGRTAKIICRGQEIGIIGEIHPSVCKNFDLKSKVAFFEIDADKLAEMSYSKTKAEDISEFQMNNFDLSFVVDKAVKGSDISTAIEKTDQKLIKKIELFDIFESEEKLPGQRSLSFKIFIQSMDETLSDNVKNELINNIVERVEKKGEKLR